MKTAKKIILAFLLILTARGAFAQEAAHNVRLDITLTENGVRRPPILKDSDREFYKQILVIEDGFYGVIYLGAKKRESGWLKKYLLDSEYAAKDFLSGAKEMAACLRIVPHIIDGKIELSIMPILTCALNGAEYGIEVKKLGVTYTVRRGKTLALNARTLEKEFFGHFFATDDGKSIGVTIAPSVLEYGGTVQ